MALQPTTTIRVLISDPVDDQCSEIFRREGYTVDLITGLTPAELNSVIPGYDVLIVRSQTKVTAEVIAAASQLKIIGRAGAGTDNIDVAAASRRGIIVMNTPGGNTISTAEHTVAMILALARNIPQADQSLRRNEWDRKRYIGVELYEKTLGVVGLGKVGREVASRCASFGMQIIGYDPVLSADAAREIAIELVGLEEIYRRSDFITIHTPLTNETRGLLNRQTLARCKRGVRIVNCARGGIVDEQALMDALTSGHAGGAALDVFAQEPPGDHPLLRHPRVIATPHLGASTEEAQEKVAVQIARQVCDTLQNRGVAGDVNAGVLRFALRTELQPFIGLAEKLGRLVGQLMSGTDARLWLQVQGGMLAEGGSALSAAFLRGLLGVHLVEPINLVNAPLVAHERGIHLEFRSEAERTEQGQQIITAGFRTETEERSFAGTVYSGKHLRLISIDGFHFETSPEGHLLFYSNIDKPGVVAAVSSILANAGVNIAGMTLGRYGPGQEALTVMSVDSPVPGDALQAIARVGGLFNVRTVSL